MQTVPFYDMASKKVINIPAAELASGAIQVQLQGRPGLVWMMADQLKQNDYRHPPFTGELRENVIKIQRAFSEHKVMTYEDWEDGFRRDANAESEIRLFLHCVNVYEQFVVDACTEEERHDIFKIVMTCSSTTLNDIWKILRLNVLTREKANLIISRFYSHL